MRARTFLVGIAVAVLVVILASVSWADWRGRGWYPPPPARVHHGWYGHPSYQPVYRHYCAPRPVYLPPPGVVVYVPGPRAVYAPVPGPVYGGGYGGSGIWVPGLSFSFSARLR
jgi:hypothetical protein